MMPEDFVHLHVHSHYSILEALPGPKALVARAKEQGAKALALTDNGALYGAVEFYKACVKEEIKPIIGLDIYVAQNRMTDKRARIDDRPYRLTLLSYSEAGYKNLLKISTLGYIEGFYYKPRVDKEFLKEHCEGLIALSGGVQGEIPHALLLGDQKKAEDLIKKYQDIFGVENFYLELIHHPDFPRQEETNDLIKALADRTGTQLVATKNIFYLDPDDRDGYEAQMCIQRGRTLEDFRRTSTQDVDLSMSKPQEIIEYFKDVPEALLNTKKIADQVDFQMDLGNNYLPIFPMPEGKTDEDYLHELAWEGIKKRYDEITPEIKERFEYEFGVIKKMGFASYFIIVQDFVTWAKDQGILVGPGRGSAAGSIISYGLRITDLDPLRYGLLFERFLNPDRISMPDVDMDFADARRGEVLEYVKQKYGEDKVAGIITFGTMMPRLAVRDMARVLGLEYEEADLIARCIPEPVQGRHTPLKVAEVEHAELRDLLKSNPMARKVIDLAKKVEGNPRHTSQHACGIVIGDVPLVERIALKEGQKEDMAYVSQFSLDSAEAAGLVKMDFLGLSNLTIIQDALEIIKAVHDVDIDIENVPLDDEQTFELLGRGETTGVFQLESDGMKRYIRDLQPTQFEDIIAMVSLYRPGPMQFIESFIKRKHGKEKITYEHPLMENAFRETYGIPVYQEQVMQVSKDMAGFTGGKADTLRKAMGKKIVELMAKMRIEFIDGAVEKGVQKKIAEKVFQKLEDFAAYGFNKSHAACYAMIAYRTAYLKARYPSEFMAAVMNSDIGTIERITIEVEECKRMGIEVLAPDVNESYPGFAVVPGTGNIRWGLAAIKNFGYEIGKAIQLERKENGQYEDLADFVARVPSKYFNKKGLESLIKAGALDRFADRGQLVSNMDQLLLLNKQSQRDKEQNQVSMFDFAPDVAEQKITLRPSPPLTKEQILDWERELLGIYISDHPAKIIKEKIGDLVVMTNQIPDKQKDDLVRMAGVIVGVRKILTKKKQEPMAFVRFEDASGPIDIVVFPKLYKTVAHWLDAGKMVLIDGKVSIRIWDEREEYSVLADKINVFTEKDFDEVVVHLRQGSLWDGKENNGSVEEEEDNGVYITVPESPDHNMIVELRALLKDSPGREQVYLLVESGSEVKKVSTEYSVTKDRQLLERIAEIVGPGNVR
ncbi:DNA polymerase III subunit alpha [Candidatus Uhrbacteria bacterium]|nr:DNA polymerase III subunit alpha [Candidatus Uhrbacteria bacterium]MBT7717520.1 DNA polymerase III subunit alpha [Candidatus Uhrbacteria bacterium]